VAAALLDGVRFFGRMSPEERAAVSALLRPVTFAAGEHLVESNVVPLGLYVIEAGRVRFQIRLPGDTQEPVWEARAGDVLGELSLTLRTLAPVSAVALEETRTWLLEAGVVDGLRQQTSPLAFAILGAMARTMCARVRYVIGIVVGEPAPPGGAEASEHRSRRPSSPSSPSCPSYPILESDLAQLAILPLFRGVGPAQLAREAAVFRRLELQRGDPLYTEGEASRGLYVVVRGAMETSVQRGGEKRRLGIAGPGRLVGELAFVSGRPHVTDAAAKERATLLALDPAAFEALREACAPLALRLFDLVALESTATLMGAGRGRRHVKRLAERAPQASSSNVETTSRPSDRSA
jgi:CRP-like cAMP-binding protein